MEYRHGSHTVYNLEYHILWTTRYRYQVLVGEVALRAREIIRQCCGARDITIIKGNVCKDHIHLLMSSRPALSVAQVLQYLKGRSSRLLQQEFPHLQKRFRGVRLKM